MILSRLKGGLGNQMFQIAAGFSKSIDLDTQYCINYGITHYGQQGKKPITYKDNFYKNISTTEETPSFVYGEPHFSYSELPNQKDMVIDGYFQTEKYFANNKDKVKNLFYFSDNIKNKIDSSLKKIKNKVLGVHVRAGDFLSPGNFSSHFICTKDYYSKALEKFDLDKYTIIVCTDSPSNLFEFFPKEDVIFSNSKNELEDLYLLSQCDDLILTNSSFSWWGSFLGKDKSNVVVPSRWFSKDGPQDYNDIYREGWIKINV
jgi:hypothetical protein